MTRNLEENTKEELMVASKSLREYFEYDLINGIDLEDGFPESDAVWAEVSAGAVAYFK